MLLSVSDHFFLIFDLFIFREGKGGRKRGRETSVRERKIHWLPLVCTQPGTEPKTQACALTRNPSGDILLCGTMSNLLSHTGQGYCLFFFFLRFHLFILDWGREGEKHQCVVGSRVSPTGDLAGPQPRHVLWLGIQPVTLWFAGWHSIHWATPARAILSYFLYTVWGRHLASKLKQWYCDTVVSVC